MTNPRRNLFFLVLIILLGAFLRLRALSDLSTSLNYDEAYYVVDAASLLENPRLTPFFAENFGRESLWMYWLAGWLAIFGQEAFAVRLATFAVNLFTLGAIYLLACELYQARRAALYSTFALAVLYWHVHFANLTWRAITYPLVGSLAFAWLWRARRTNRWSHWLLAGGMLATLSYTYFSARVWLLLALGMLVYAFLTEPTRRRGIAVAVGIAILGSLPLILYSSLNAELANQRLAILAPTSIEQVLGYIPEWLGTWFIRGADNNGYNLPYRPILDPPLAILWGIGLVGVFVAVRERLQAGFIYLLALGSSVINLLTVDPLNMVRMIGTVIPLALLAGAGAWTLERVLVRLRLRWASVGVPIVLLIGSGVLVNRDVQRWLDHDLMLFYEQHVYQASNYIRAHVAEETPVYFSPFTPEHPVFRFHAPRLAPRHVGAMDGMACWVMPEQGHAVYTAITIFDPDFATRLSQWGAVQPLYADPHHTTPYYQVYDFTVNDAQWASDPAWMFGEMLAVRLYGDENAILERGATLSLQAVAQANLAPDHTQTLFLHLYGDPTPAEGGRLYAQTDAPLCTSYPVRFWQATEMIVQPLTFTLPTDLPNGTYQLVLGMYDATTLQRQLTREGADTVPVLTFTLAD